MLSLSLFLMIPRKIWTKSQSPLILCLNPKMKQLHFSSKIQFFHFPLIRTKSLYWKSEAKLKIIPTNSLQFFSKYSRFSVDWRFYSTPGKYRYHPETDNFLEVTVKPDLVQKSMILHIHIRLSKFNLSHRSSNQHSIFPIYQELGTGRER